MAIEDVKFELQQGLTNNEAKNWFRLILKMA